MRRIGILVRIIRAQVSPVPPVAVSRRSYSPPSLEGPFPSKQNLSTPGVPGKMTGPWKVDEEGSNGEELDPSGDFPFNREYLPQSTHFIIPNFFTHSRQVVYGTVPR
jgi:hypothetical protein